MMLPAESTARLRSSIPPVELNIFGNWTSLTPLAENFSRVRSESQVFSARRTLPLGSTVMDRIGADGVFVKFVTVLPSGGWLGDRLVSIEALATSTLPVESAATARTASVSLSDRVQS